MVQPLTPTNLEEFVTYYLDRLAADENAWFALVEAPDAIVPLLASAFRCEADPVKRSTILNIIWQRRDPSTIPLLAEGLQDASPGVWKEALERLVMIGGPQGISEIEAARSRLVDSKDDRAQFREFLDEPLEQLRRGSR